MLTTTRVQKRPRPRYSSEIQPHSLEPLNKTPWYCAYVIINDTVFKKDTVKQFLYNSPGGVLTAKNDKDNVLQVLIFYDSQYAP